MSFKNELKNLGYYLITPVPAKYHFEGVDNRRSARQLLAGMIVLNVVAITAAIAGPAIEEKILDLKQRFTKDKKTLDKN